MLTFSAWTVISLLGHNSATDSGSWFALVDRVAAPFALFALGGCFFRTEKQRDLLLRVIVLIGLYLGVTAVFEVYLPTLVWPRYITDPTVGLGYGRARGPFASPEGMGAALAICGAASVLCAARLRRWRVLATLCVAIDLIGVLLCLTRAIWLAAIAGLIVAAVLSPGIRRRLAPATALVVLGLGLLFVLTPGLSAKLTSRTEDADSVYDRLGSTDAAVRMLHDKPWTGIGWRRFFPDGADWVRQSDAYPINHVIIELHNVVLSRTAELGIPAGICFVAILWFRPSLSSVVVSGVSASRGEFLPSCA